MEIYTLFFVAWCLCGYSPGDKIQATKAQSHKVFLYNIPGHRLSCQYSYNLDK